LAVEPELAGIATVVEALPEVHGRVFGNPARDGVEEKVQVVTPTNDADSVTEPPALGSVVGVAVNEVMDGTGGPATFTDTGLAFTFLDPTADRLNL
jgi:hypothetical protein